MVSICVLMFVLEIVVETVVQSVSLGAINIKPSWFLAQSTTLKYKNHYESLCMARDYYAEKSTRQHSVIQLSGYRGTTSDARGPGSEANELVFTGG